VTLALLVAAVCLAGAVAETAVADGPRRPPRGSSEGKAERKSVASVIAARFRELRENAKETFGEIFGKEPVWDNTFEFEIPERFRALSLDTFARWFNGALPGERDADAERHLAEGRTEQEIMTLMQESEGEEAAAQADTAPIPAKYDFYEKYPACLGKEFDQGSCGSVRFFP
jgi:hypothetical protein